MPPASGEAGSASAAVVESHAAKHSGAASASVAVDDAVESGAVGSEGAAAGENHAAWNGEVGSSTAPLSRMPPRGETSSESATAVGAAGSSAAGDASAAVMDTADSRS